MDVVRFIKLSQANYQKIQEILVWAAGYNVFVISLATGVLAPIGILLSPAVEALLMSLSTAIVAILAGGALRMTKDAEITERLERVDEIIDQLDADKCDRDEGEALYKEEQRLLVEVRDRLGSSTLLPRQFSRVTYCTRLF